MTDQPSLTKEGWYLLSAREGDSINRLIGDENTFTYWKKQDLDISDVYVPLHKDFSSNNASLNSDDNQVTDISANHLKFGETIGTVLDYNDYSANYFGLISDFDGIFGANTGIWVYLQQRTLQPVLKLIITNRVQTLDAALNTTTYTDSTSDARKSYPVIVDISSNSTRVTNALSDLLTDTNTPKSVDISENIVINLTVERDLTFNYNSIFGGTIVEDNNSSQYQLEEFANNNNNPYNNYRFGGNFSSSSNSFSSMDSSGTLTYTIVNSTPNSDESFNVIINIDVSDNINPTIRLTQPTTTTGTPLTFFDQTSNGASLDQLADNNQLYYYGENSLNKVYIKLNQTFIKANPNTDFRPGADLLDQISTLLTSAVTKTDISATIYDPITDISGDRKYSRGEWRPGVYNMIYTGQDITGKKCKVDISFEIVDNIPPNFTINNVGGQFLYQNFTSNISTNIRDDNVLQSNFSNSTIQEVGRTLDSPFTEITTTNNPITTNIYYIKYTDISTNGSINLPRISTYTDFSGINQNNNPSYFTLVNNISAPTLALYTPDVSMISVTDLFDEIENYDIEAIQPHIDRKYTVKDKQNKEQTITLPITIYDNTVQTVDVSYTSVKIKNHTSENSLSDPFGNAHPENVIESGTILNQNVINNGSIIIDQYNDIQFSLQFSKECRCFIDIYNNQTWNAAPNFTIQDNGIYNTNHTLKLNATHTTSLGTHTLYFRTYDKNDNSFKFKYDLSVNEIPPFTFRLISEQSKQKLLLRSNVAHSTLNSLRPVCLVNFALDVKPPVTNNSSFVDDSRIYVNNYDLISSNYDKTIIPNVTINQNGIEVPLDKATIGLEVKGSGFVTKIPSNVINNGYFYEIMNFPQLSVQESGSTTTTTSFRFENIEKFKVIKIDTVNENQGNIATQTGNSTEMKQNVRYYDASNILQSF